MADDRYPTDPMSGPAALAQELRELKRRVKELEASRPLGNTTLANGTLQVMDDNGFLLMEVGKISDRGVERYGLAVYVPSSGKPMFLATADGGIEYPGIDMRFVPFDGQRATVSGSFTAIYSARNLSIVADAFYVIVPWATDGATTGEVRLSDVYGGNTSAVALAGGSSGSVTFKWLHGWFINDPLNLRIEARRTAGAGNVYIYEPVMATQIAGDYVLATPSGL